MRVRVLGCAGAEFPGHRSSSFLIGSSILLDAGTVGSVLTEEEQWQVRHIFLTHAHLDHIKGIPLLADNIIIRNLSHQIVVYGIKPVLDALREHLMNNVIWPDFSVIPSPDSPIVVYREIEPGEEVEVEGYRVRATAVRHSVPAVAYTVRDGKSSLCYTGDTGPTEKLWNSLGKLDALIVEVSFPDAMEDLAILTGHLTPGLLLRELRQLPALPGRILITHLKPQHFDAIRSQLQELPIALEILKDDAVFTL